MHTRPTLSQNPWVYAAVVCLDTHFGDACHSRWTKYSDSYFLHIRQDHDTKRVSCQGFENRAGNSGRGRLLVYNDDDGIYLGRGSEGVVDSGGVHPSTKIRASTWA